MGGKKSSKDFDAWVEDTKEALGESLKQDYAPIFREYASEPYTVGGKMFRGVFCGIAYNLFKERVHRLGEKEEPVPLRVGSKYF